MITSYVDTANYLTHQQLQEIDGSNLWDVASHGAAHINYRTAADQATVESDLTTAKNALDALGLNRASAHVAYPYGAYDAKTLAAMAATGMLSGRTTRYGEIVPTSTPVLQIPCNYVTSAITLDQVKGWISRYSQNGQICGLFFHGLTEGVPADETEWKLSDFEALVDYLAGLPTMTITELYAAMTT